MHATHISYRKLNLQAMQRMKEYERKLTREDEKDTSGASPEMRSSPRKNIQAAVMRGAAARDVDSVASSSAQDNCSESSMSDFPVCIKLSCVYCFNHICG